MKLKPEDLDRIQALAECESGADLPHSAAYLDAVRPEIVCELVRLARTSPEFARRTSNGVEIEPEWSMPEPPHPGLIPCFEMHGSDGCSLFWWHPDWGKSPNSIIAWRKCEELGWHYIDELLCEPEPLVYMDTGAGYKATAEALRELGFKGC